MSRFSITCNEGRRPKRESMGDGTMSDTLLIYNPEGIRVDEIGQLKGSLYERGRRLGVRNLSARYEKGKGAKTVQKRSRNGRGGRPGPLGSSVCVWFSVGFEGKKGFIAEGEDVACFPSKGEVCSSSRRGGVGRGSKVIRGK